MTRRPQNIFPAYHAHVYFDQDTADSASLICQQAGTKFDIGVGGFHKKPVGPHTRWSCQLAFEQNQFNQVIPWLEANRENLTVFVHGLTGDDLKDHTEHASWLGTEVELDLTMFQ